MSKENPMRTPAVIAFVAVGMLTAAAGGALLAPHLSATPPPSVAVAAETPTNEPAAAHPMLVRIIRPDDAATAAALTLPGSSSPIEEAVLFARVNGYIHERLVDIGDKVRAGQVLARIEAPEIDHQLARAEAQVKQAEANRRLAELNLERARLLVEKDHISRQVYDERAADLDVRRADLQAAEAEVRRFRDLQGYQQITAPFAGIVVSRNVEKGDLVQADTPDPDRYLFRIARLDVLRVTIDVPQTEVARVRVGTPAEVRFTEFPGATLKGSVVRTAGRLDTASRTLRAEIHLANPQGLPAGMIGQVMLGSLGTALVTVPINTLITDAGGPQVAIVGAEDTIHFAPVALGRNLGAKVEILQGVGSGDRIVINPNGLLRAGDKVVVQP